MRTLSYWAGRHVRLAIFLIVLGEVVNGFNGVLLGATVLGDLPLGCLYTSMLALIGLAIYIQRYATSTDLSAHYWTGRRWLFVAFLSNFLLFNLLGGIWNQRVQTANPGASVLGSRRIVMVGDTVASADSVRLANRSIRKADAPTSGKQTSQRGLYIVLGILGLVVAYVVTGLACNIACAGNGFLAVLAFYLGLGGLAGSVYYFGRAAQKSPKRRRDMTADERRRDSRRFWLPWVILIGIASIFLLASANK